MERVGTIFKASEETAKSGKEVFKLGIRVGEKDWEYTLFDPAQIKVATEHKGRNVKLTVEKGDSGFWNVQSIEPVDGPVAEAMGNGRDKAIADQVAVKAVADLWAAGCLMDGTPEVQGLRVWLREHLPAPQEKAPAKKAPANALAQLDADLKRLLAVQLVRLGYDQSNGPGMAAWVYDVYEREWADLTYDEKCVVITKAESTQ